MLRNTVAAFPEVCLEVITEQGRCNHAARACTGKDFLEPGGNSGRTRSAPDPGTGLSLTSPSIAVEHGHIDVRGASVSQQAVV